jgi:hypothetical protein
VNNFRKTLFRPEKKKPETMPRALYITMLELPASAAGQNGTKQANDYDNHLLHRDHPHFQIPGKPRRGLSWFSPR